MANLSEQFALRQLHDSLSPLAHLLDGADVQEIMINGPDDVWVERAGERLKPCTEIKISMYQIEGAIQILAKLNNKDAKGGTPDGLIDARMEGFRIAAALPPTSVRGPSISIRKHNPVVLTLEDYVRSGNIPGEWASKFREMIAAHKNILVVGGTSSGKTTFVNALIREIAQDERVITIEDTPELKVLVPNWISLEANPQAGVTSRMLVRLSLRYRPDRILIGEIRDATGYDLLDAANTGHDGALATFHANSAADALSRFETFVLQANLGWPHEAICRQIARTFDYVVFMARRDGVRKLCEVLHLHDYQRDSSSYIYDVLYNADSVK